MSRRKEAGAGTDVERNGAGRHIPSVKPDYPLPRVYDDEREFTWDEDRLAVDNYSALAQRLAAAGDLYRRPAYAGGLILASPEPNIEPVVISTGRQLACVIVDRVRVRVVKDGESKGSTIPVMHLATMLGAEVFLREFAPVDDVVRTPQYLNNFELTRPGYNDSGPGQRLLYVGPEPAIATGTDAITAFLDVMAFASNADRTNSVAAALTVLLRHHWPGAKPLLAVTSTKSHGGKDTVLQFACGCTAHVAISYQATDWALERSFVGAVNHSPQAGVVVIENARLGRGAKQIASAFLERLLTDPEPLFFSTGTGAPVRRKNHLVLGASTNYGSISEDMMNRGLPVHLNPVGNVADRRPSIGNPKLEYLPAHRERIEAELRGMIERWKAAGRPLDEDVRHPFTDWSRTVGGILKANGFSDFLANYAVRRTADDPVRRGLGLLGAARPDAWLRAAEWSRLTTRLGLVKDLLPEGDRDTDAARQRGVGVVLSAHRDETFHTETEDERLTVRLEKARRRFDGNEASTRYRFVVIDRDRLPEDAEVGGKAGGGAPGSSSSKEAGTRKETLSHRPKGRGRIDRGLKPRRADDYNNVDCGGDEDPEEQWEREWEARQAKASGKKTPRKQK